MPNVFVFGTLMFEEVSRSLIGEHQAKTPATLRGFRRFEAKTRTRGNYPTIQREEGACVDGLALLGLEPRQIAALDRFEAVSDGLYLRQTEPVLLSGLPPTDANSADFPVNIVPCSVYVTGPKPLATDMSISL